MSTACRTLRFRSTGSAGSAVTGAQPVVDLFINDETIPAGHIVRLEQAPGTPARWAYVLRDGRATGLQSTHSRGDLELRVMDYYFEGMATDQRHSA